MSIYRYLILSLALAGLAMVTEAQNPPLQTTNNSGSSNRSVPQPALSGLAEIGADVAGDGTASDMPQIPAMLGGKGASLAFQSELGRSNYLRAGLNVGTAYDDNALLGTNGAVGNASYSVFPSLALEESWSRVRWTLAYAGGFTFNQRLTNQNQGSHNFRFDSDFRLSPHVNLRVAEDFAVTTGFFNGGDSFAATATSGPNVSLITPLATQRTNSTTVAANYHFALNDVIGGSGSFYDMHFTNAPADSLLVDTRTATGSAFWLRRIFGRNWAGASYSYQWMTFDPSGGETRVHSFAVVDTLTLPRGFSLSGFLGPQYSEDRGTPTGGGEILQFQNWNMAGGLEVGWQGVRTSMSTGFSRRITDGGGLLVAVRSQSVHGGVRRQLLPLWAVGFGASYGNNDALTAAFGGSASTINLTSISASLERNVGKSLGLRFGYAHDFQQQSGVSDPAQKFDTHRNRFFVTLSYQWAKPLGM